VRVISRKRLREFWESPLGQGSRQALQAWFWETRKAQWKNPYELKDEYPTASILKNGRAVFNISGNKFRLVAAIRYDLGIVFIRFVGTHSQYDRINAQEF
jgi:mRNA interferase HigB